MVQHVGGRPGPARLVARPVFVDESGRRLSRLRATTWSAGALLAAFAGMIALAVLGSVGGPGHWAVPDARTAPRPAVSAQASPRPAGAGALPAGRIAITGVRATSGTKAGAARGAAQAGTAGQTVKGSATTSAVAAPAPASTAAPTPTASAHGSSSSAPGQVRRTPKP